MKDIIPLIDSTVSRTFNPKCVRCDKNIKNSKNRLYCKECSIEVNKEATIKTNKKRIKRNHCILCGKNCFGKRCRECYIGKKYGLSYRKPKSERR